MTIKLELSQEQYELLAEILRAAVIDSNYEPTPDERALVQDVQAAGVRQ